MMGQGPYVRSTATDRTWIGVTMSDAELIERIDQLVREEHELEQNHGSGRLDVHERDRLREIEVALDQCWDFLRQRKARRAAGQDADLASERPQATVEGYLQ